MRQSCGARFCSASPSSPATGAACCKPDYPSLRFIYGSLLGVFLLGLLTRRVGENAAMCAMAAGLVLMLYIRFVTPIAFTWYVLIGTSATFATGLAASVFFSGRTGQVHTTEPALRRALGLWAAIAIVIGTAIGSGIFLVPTDMVKAVGIAGQGFRGLDFRRDSHPVRRADLRRAFRRAARRRRRICLSTAAYGPFFGFIYGWTQTWVAKSGLHRHPRHRIFHVSGRFFPRPAGRHLIPFLCPSARMAARSKFAPDSCSASA